MADIVSPPPPRTWPAAPTGKVFSSKLKCALIVVASFSTLLRANYSSTVVVLLCKMLVHNYDPHYHAFMPAPVPTTTKPLPHTHIYTYYGAPHAPVKEHVPLPAGYAKSTCCNHLFISLWGKKNLQNTIGIKIFSPFSWSFKALSVKREKLKNNVKTG